MRVSAQSPVQDDNSYLHKWDTTARKYFNHFEVHKQSIREGIHRLSQNILTRHRDPIQFRHRFEEADQITYRQYLGDISKQEVKEVNKVFGGSSGLYFMKG